MAELAQMVIAREAFSLHRGERVIPKGTIIHIIKNGTEGYDIYSKKGKYIGYAQNIPYEDIKT